MSGTTVALVRVKGSAGEVGYQHGLARAAQLRAFLDDDLARINKLASAPTSLAALEPLLADYAAAIERATPALSEEIAGLAEGAGISVAEATLLQVRRELIGYQKIPARGDCTTYASLRHGPAGGPVLAQTVDLNGNLDDQLAVLDITLAQSSRRALVLSFGGLLGYLGINSDGLAIGLNLVLGGDWKPGLPPYLAIRYLLDAAGSVDEALKILPDLPLASSRSLTLCDQDRLACVEILDGQVKVLPVGETCVHANHYLDPGFAAADELNVFARNSSLARLKAGSAGLESFGGAGGVEVERHFELLSQPVICVGDTGDIRRERTVAAVVMVPDQGELHVRPGDPSRSGTVTFRIGRP
ncbi:MAG TPA: C45 family peptidase [Streptosporangiaceae bacterium]|jgi:predicted choloylglycine hydrolase|nr:C45 family peptidase [Streptosporangiaceae bacterium]